MSASASTANQLLTVTYSTPVVHTNLKVPTLGITDLGYQIPGNEVLVFIVLDGYSSSYLRMSLQFNDNTYVSTLKLTYLTIDNTFTPSFSMNYFFPVSFVTI